MTLANKIRKMSDEELATYLANITHASAASGARLNTEFPSFPKSYYFRQIGLAKSINS